MNQTRKQFFSVISVVLSLLMVISVISFPSLNAKADGYAGTLDDFVERCYTVTLGRGSDPDGFADWKGQLLNGKAVGIEVAYGFLFSPEYTKKNKSNEDYVKDLYMLFMGREPDPDGFNDWVGQLNSGKSRLDVFTGFANSQEFYNICESYGITAGRYVKGSDRQSINNVNLFVERLYKICLGRIGDKGGQNNWVEKLITKQISGSECARSFIFSKEYVNKNLSDEEFVENLYLAMMGRPSDADGKANWLKALSEGKTRDEVFAGFANSSEFASLCEQYKIEKGNYVAKDVYKPLRFRLKKETDSNGQYLTYEYKGDSIEEYKALRYSKDGALLGIESQIEKIENGERTINSGIDPNTGAVSYSQRREAVWNSDKTKCVTTYYDELKGGAVTGYLEEFYENGKIVKLRAYDKDHNLGRTAEYTYPEKNRVISDDYSFTMQAGSIEDEKNYYDENGVLTKTECKITSLGKDRAIGREYTVVWEYENGNLIKEYSYEKGEEQNIHMMVSYEYKDGKLYKEYSYRSNSNTEITGWDLYEYNSKGLLVKKARYNAESNDEVYGNIYEYDEYDNKIKESGFTHIIDYTYHDEIEITYWTSWEYEKY